MLAQVTSFALIGLGGAAVDKEDIMWGASLPDVGSLAATLLLVGHTTPLDSVTCSRPKPGLWKLTH